MSDKIYEILEKEITKEKENELKKLLEPYKGGLAGIAQINPIVGDLEYNSKKIVQHINLAQNIGLDTVIFPELALTGVLIEDIAKRHPFIVDENLKWLNEISKITKKTTAIVGFIEKNGDEFCNSVAILSDGKIQNILGKSGGSVVINGIKYGILIGDDCSDINDDIDVLINCSASESRTNKEQIKHGILSFTAKKYGVPLIYVNQVGANDSLSFDGASRVYDNEGRLIARAKSFEEQFLIVNPLKNLGKIYPSVKGLDEAAGECFTLDYEFDLERTYKTIIQGIRDYFGKTGFKRAVLGLSGGLDSSVCAVLLADALGAENVFGVSMPSKITSDNSKNDAGELAQNLGINFATASIKDVFEVTNGCLQDLFKSVETKWDGRYTKSFTPDNIQARSRAMFLWGVANEFDKTLPIATSDKSEAYVGYATVNGDMSGGFAPIADVTKTKLFALARWLNANRPVKNAIPENVILKKPGAELAINPKTGKALIAEDALMPYEFMDEIIWRIENKKESYNDMLNSEFLYERKNSVSKEQKIEWLDKFYRRMSTSLYKWSISAPSVMVDYKSINKCEYTQPITSSRINYKGYSEAEINKKIQTFLT